MVTGHENAPAVDVRERGNDANGQPIAMDRRLFMQLMAFRCEPGFSPDDATRVLGELFVQRNISSVIYQDVNDPKGLAVLTFSEAPEYFVRQVRPIYADPRLTQLTLRPEYTMIGRTYSTGFEQDLEYWLLRRPRETVLNAAWPWAIWYPLRRKGGFERLDPREKGGIMREHGTVGRAYGEADLAHDVRLACQGLDANDNDFVIGLIGKELHPLSHVVQAMRGTRQTAEFLERLGPFLTGYAVFRHAG